MEDWLARGEPTDKILGGGSGYGYVDGFELINEATGSLLQSLAN